MEAKRCLGLVFTILLLLSSSYEAIGDATIGVGIGEEKRTCESGSHNFKGPCVSDHNCGLVCRNEGFSNGWCRGFRRRCFCTRQC